jgi:hypothetical protein
MAANFTMRQVRKDFDRLRFFFARSPGEKQGHFDPVFPGNVTIFSC